MTPNEVYDDSQIQTNDDDDQRYNSLHNLIEIYCIARYIPDVDR